MNSLKVPYIELNAIQNALILIEGKPSEIDLSVAANQLRLFCEYAQERAQKEVFWHDFLNEKFQTKAGMLKMFFGEIMSVFSRHENR